MKHDATGTASHTAASITGSSAGKLLLGGLAFVLLTAGIFWYQFHRIQTGDTAPRWSDLRWGYCLLILLVLPVETVASALRTWLLARVLQPGVSFWTAVQAEWANVAISLLTPSQSGGGPGQVYVLTRGGARVGTALTIALLSFLGTMVGLFLMGLYSLFVSRIGATGPLFVGAVWSLTLISAAMVLAAAWPGLVRASITGTARGLAWVSRGAWRADRPAARLVEIVDTYRDDVRRFLRAGKLSFAWVCLLSLTFLSSRALLPFLCARFLGLEGGSLGHVLEVQLALIFLIFFAPTPGGAGIAEGASLAIMADLVPVGYAPYYNLLWRFSTAYLAALAGLLCLLRAALGDARQAIGRRTAPAHHPLTATEGS